MPTMTAEFAAVAAFTAVMVGALLFAFWKGGAAERAGAALIVVMAAIQWSARAFTEPSFDRTDFVPLLVDVIGFAGFTWIGLHARRYWPLFAAALQLLSLAGHLARGVDMAIDPLAYLIMKSGPTFITFLLLVIGTTNYRRRIRRKRPAA